MLRTWLYVSTSLVGSDDEATIANIRSAAERRNPELQLTGVLLFSGQHFAQVLEGPGAALEVMKACICADRRHQDVVTLQFGMRARRDYEKWSLAYSGHAPGIDAVIAYALKTGDAEILLKYVDAFVARLQ